MVDNYKEELIEYIKAKKEYEEIENQYNVLIKYKLAQEQIEIIISEEKLKTVSKAHHLINQELEDLDKKFDSISKKYYKLRYELNPDNLRNVMYHLMTNEKLTESELAEEIGNLYHSRWQIELFFKHIKQHMTIKTYYSKAEVGVENQLIMALIVYLLTFLIKLELNLKPTIFQILRHLRSVKFESYDYFIALFEPG